MPRLFVAIVPPRQVKQQLLDLSEDGMAEVRWSGIDRFHITLRFIGEVHGGIARDIDDALAAITAQPFQLCLKQTGYFANRRLARVLWAGVEQLNDAPDGPLDILNYKVERALADIGLAPEHRKFRPHVTLARSKKLPRFAAEDYCARHSNFVSAAFQVDRFHLMSSQLASAGAHYRIEAEYPLCETLP